RVLPVQPPPEGRGTQTPPVQLPLQQSALAVHILLSEVHAGRLQTPPVHVPEQHSEASMHAAPTWEQLPPAPKPVPALAPVPMDPVLAVAPVPDIVPVPAPPMEPELVMPLLLPQPAARPPPAGSARATRTIARLRSCIGVPFTGG